MSTKSPEFGSVWTRRRECQRWLTPCHRWLTPWCSGGQLHTACNGVGTRASIDDELFSRPALGAGDENGVAGARHGLCFSYERQGSRARTPDIFDERRPVPYRGVLPPTVAQAARSSSTIGAVGRRFPNRAPSPNTRRRSVRLDQSAFAVHVGDPCGLPESFCHTANDPEGAIDVEQIELPRSQDRAQLRVELAPEVVQPLR